MKKLLIPIIIVVGISTIVVLSYGKQDSSTSNKPSTALDTTIAKPNTQENGPAGLYTEYSAEKLAQTPADGKNVIFFHASWCPSCRSADKDIKNNLSSIPENLTILKTDYDTQKNLRKKYGVTGQHTFVQVDSEGEMITKWSGGDLSTIISRIK
ncbi:MAG: thioredoxin family protein [Candidatus Pacebacteria bacterium]|jgi:thioredoxin 1|nr:thioredoxin family protein [Candidatus Paceibacterota bacterium]MBT4652130.1 thioredoxin family protein [Candidatus Paceibacterota bacterium]MBT6756561.1 thioredoxin family protein [Candidatus Paceibacterota bacterium]